MREKKNNSSSYKSELSQDHFSDLKFKNHSEDLNLVKRKDERGYINKLYDYVDYLESQARKNNA